MEIHLNRVDYLQVIPSLFLVGDWCDYFSAKMYQIITLSIIMCYDKRGRLV